MCNEIHEDSRKIPKTGEGFKIFTFHGTSFYQMTGICQNSPYDCTNDGRVVWDKYLAASDDDGFCFFLKKEDALLILKEWQKSFPTETFVLLPIKYWGGLGKHMEERIIHYPACIVEIALCKEFKIIF
jgi:hypothetical protein